MPNNIVRSLAEKSGRSIEEVEELWKKAKAITTHKLGVTEGEQFYKYATGILKNMLSLRSVSVSVSNAFSTKVEPVKLPVVNTAREQDIHVLVSSELNRLKPILAKKRGVVKKAVSALQKFQAMQELTLEEKGYANEFIRILMHHVCQHVEELSPMLHTANEFSGKYSTYLGSSFKSKEVFDRDHYGYDQVKYDSSVSPLILSTDDSEFSMLTSLLTDIITWSLRECNLTKQHKGTTNAISKYSSNNKLLPSSIRRERR